MKIERETNHKRLITLGNKLRVAGGEVVGGWDNWVMDMKEGTRCDEHWVFYATDESLNPTSETSNNKEW